MKLIGKAILTGIGLCVVGLLLMIIFWYVADTIMWIGVLGVTMLIAGFVTIAIAYMPIRQRFIKDFIERFSKK